MNSAHPSILVVDDDVDACHNLTDILMELGYRVDFAHDGSTALELVRKETYDVALLDLRMPGMDGLTLYREIRKISAGTVAIIVTAYASGDTQDEALAIGALQVVPKPVDPTGLLRLVDHALDLPLVLVVDDDKDLCANLWDLFHERDYRICLAHDTTDAARMLQERDYKVVLLDMKLPNAGGRDVFNLVRQANPKARTVIITGFRSEMELLVQKLVAEGADAVCYKPFDVPQLLSTVARLVDKDAPDLSPPEIAR